MELLSELIITWLKFIMNLILYFPGLSSVICWTTSNSAGRMIAETFEL